MVQCFLVFTLQDLLSSNPTIETRSTASSRPKRSNLSALKRWARYFSITEIQDKLIFLTGGEDLDCNILHETWSYFIEFDKWQREPDLKIARNSHSSCSSNERVHVFCGFDEGSVESLRVGAAQAWEVIVQSFELTRRV